MAHLMAEKNENNKDSQKGQATPKKLKKNYFVHIFDFFLFVYSYRW